MNDVTEEDLKYYLTNVIETKQITNITQFAKYTAASKDGRILFVSEPLGEVPIIGPGGMIYVYYSNDDWETYQQIGVIGSISVSDSAEFGIRIESSDNGLVLFVKSTEGFQYICTPNDGKDWSSMASIENVGVFGFDGPIQISGNGLVIAYGDPTADESTGSVYIHTRSSTNQSFGILKLVLEGDAQLVPEQFGSNILLSNDGSRLVVSAPFGVAGSGLVRIYDSADNWNSFTMKEIENPFAIEDSSRRFGIALLGKSLDLNRFVVARILNIRFTPYTLNVFVTTDNWDTYHASPDIEQYEFPSEFPQILTSPIATFMNTFFVSHAIEDVSYPNSLRGETHVLRTTDEWQTFETVQIISHENTVDIPNTYRPNASSTMSDDENVVFVSDVLNGKVYIFNLFNVDPNVDPGVFVRGAIQGVDRGITGKPSRDAYFNNISVNGSRLNGTVQNDMYFSVVRTADQRSNRQSNGNVQKDVAYTRLQQGS